ncbi:MAG: SAM-dependent methyltransferase [Planctomycetota bacterium]
MLTDVEVRVIEAIGRACDDNDGGLSLGEIAHAADLERNKSSISQALARMDGAFVESLPGPGRGGRYRLLPAGRGLAYRLQAVDRHLAPKLLSLMAPSERSEPTLTKLLDRTSKSLRTVTRRQGELNAFDKANVARFYDYLIDGMFYFPIEVEAAESLMSVAPFVRDASRANRFFLRRATAHCARHGIRQFIDIGAGLPSMGSMHEVIESVVGHDEPYRILYVDWDESVVQTTRYMVEDRADFVRAAVGDLQEPEEILEQAIEFGIDLSEPVALVAVAVLPFVLDDDRADSALTRFKAALAPGSRLVLSHGTRPPGMEQEAREVMARYGSLVGDAILREPGQIEAYFAGLDLEPAVEGAEPGLVFTPHWRPDIADRYAFGEPIPLVDSPELSMTLCGVGVKA